VAVRPVRIYGDPVLRQKAQPVTSFDDGLRELVEDLRDTMAAYEGVGLAANQIGVTRRVFVIDVRGEGEERTRIAVVNPVITSRSGSDAEEEGCLSIPGVWAEVTRPERVTLQGKDEHGDPLEVQADGMLARAIQHELDHLDGVLFVDKLSMLKRQFLKRTLEGLARGDVPEGYHPPEAGEASR
jgi:peptide deformylase